MAFLPRPEFANPAGMVQGGFVCAMLDDAMGVTASISQRFEILVPTLQISVSYLRPTPMSRVIARGEVLRMGGSTAHLQGSLRLPDGTLLATASAQRRAAAVSGPRPGSDPSRLTSRAIGTAGGEGSDPVR